MANRKRNIQMKFYVTEEEKRLINKKMAQLPTRRYGAYLRKMAIDGYIIYTDTTEIKAFTSELSAIGRNINQIAKRINAGGPAYQADMEEIRERLDEILMTGKLGIVPSFSMLARYLVSIFTFSAKSFRARFFAFRASFTSAPKVSKPGQSFTFAIQHHPHTFYIS